MKKIFPLIIVVVIVAIITVFTVSRNDSSMNTQNMPAENNSSEDQAEAQIQPEENEIIIQDFAFNPETTTIKKGTTLTWTNQDSARHDIMPDNPSNDFKASELLGKGESYSFTFNTVGSFSYFCSPHPYMKATVVVTE
ncbi:MAG: plastocyanin/azurin family copper-binding protein [bacterium]|nr:plastocyanin/azurin family copper-binding protein [bacterium]